MIQQRIRFDNDRGWFEYIPVPRRLTCKLIQEVVADYYGLHHYHMTSPEKHKNLVRARHVAMYIVRDITKKSLPDIGNLFGGRDHSTIIHGLRKIEAERATDAELDNDIRLIEARLTA